LLAALLVLIACSSTFANDDHWVTTWACGEQLVEPNNLPPVSLANSTLREFVRNSIGGQTIRVRFSNPYGAGPVTMNAAHVALSAGARSAGTVFSLNLDSAQFYALRSFSALAGNGTNADGAFPVAPVTRVGNSL
jgi:hypothetical protein